MSRLPSPDSGLESTHSVELQQAQGTIIGDHAQVTQTFQVAAISSGHSVSPDRPVPRQLPVATRHFAGRATQLETLTSLMEESVDMAGTVVISAIDGTAGIGKTALAVHWAHQVAQQFPDGQLYVNLRGFDPTGAAMTPAEAVRDFLDAFKVPPERIPLSLEAQSALYRSLLAGRRVLVVLDNARDVNQVRPLLPGSPGCLVLVTSRRRLTSLVMTEGAHSVPLDLLTDDEAWELLVRRLGPERVGAEPHAIEEIIARSARLPLALSIVAARAEAHPGFSLSTLAAELRRAQGQLDAFDGGDLSSNVRAVFSWSYDWLSAEAAWTFRLLGLHPGPDFTAPAVASLTGIPPRQVHPALAELARAHLLKEHTPERFVFHDLLHAYAAEQTHVHDGEAERNAALRRLLDHYLHTAHRAGCLFHPRWETISLAPPHAGVMVEKLTNYAEALAWLDVEYAALLAAIQLAVDTGQNDHAWQLPCILGDSYFQRRGHWRDWAATQQTALIAAQRGADRYGQAHAHRSLGRACAWLGRYDEAHAHAGRALRLFEEFGDQVGQANTHTVIGTVFGQQGRPDEALPHARRALNLHRAAGYLAGQARALNNLGWSQALLGDPQQGLIHCQQSLALQRDLGDGWGESNALDSVGYAYHLLGHHAEAIRFYRQVLDLKRELGDRHGLAATLVHLGDAYHAVDDPDAACDAWQQALDILDHLGLAIGSGRGPGYPDADEVRAKLRGVGGCPK